jgi:hypothetical protein
VRGRANGFYVGSVLLLGVLLVYATFVGTSSITDTGIDIAVDGARNGHVTPFARSADFPTTMDPRRESLQNHLGLSMLYDGATGQTQIQQSMAWVLGPLWLHYEFSLQPAFAQQAGFYQGEGWELHMAVRIISCLRKLAATCS